MPIQKWSEQIWIAQLNDEPALSEDLVSLSHEVVHTSGHPHIVVDFSSVTRLSSSNLSQLLRLRKQAIDHDAKMKLTSLADPIWVVFLTTGLDKVFDFVPDVPTALASLQLES
ncbi:MAG: hypothetical protein CMJ18_14790 [Phycisphaeraceae bacterium]|nr:hypothetical protein [Phycisphaeraceae bacterium]